VGSQEADLAVGLLRRQKEQGTLNELVAAPGASGPKPELPRASCILHVHLVKTPLSVKGEVKLGPRGTPKTGQ
jgi:hypothetical protein